MIKKLSFLKSKFDRWFNTKSEYLLLAAITLFGIATSAYTCPLLYNFKAVFGKDLLGVFVPPILCVLYLTYSSFRGTLSQRHLIQTLASFCIQIAFFAPTFFQPFEATNADDFGRYYIYARNMIEQRTLWSGDKLFFKDAGYHYVTQPGYRYIISLELFIFGGLLRLTQFTNLALYIISVFLLQRSVQAAISHNQTVRIVLALIFLCTPYAVKNVLMGLSEWFAVMLLISACYLYVVRKQYLLVAFALALIPFFRQNLLITSILFFVCMIWNKPNKSLISLVFVLVLLLPVYHNLYYANEWRFFVDVFELPFLKYSGHIRSFDGTIIINNLLHYLGLDIAGSDITVHFIAAVFLPLSVFVYGWLFSKLKSRNIQLTYLAITLSAIIPTILLGNAYYPRFEFVNVVIALVCYIWLVTSCEPVVKSVLHHRLP